MKKDILIVVSSNRGIDRMTEECINPLLHDRAEIVKQLGCSCVALARNYALTDACMVLRQNSNLKTVLMIDDDMTFTPTNAYEVVAHSVKTGIATSGAFVTQQGKFAARPLSKDRWIAGLAFLAIPAHKLLSLQNESKKITAKVDSPVTAFTWSGEENGEWISEDFRLCKRLGGVVILPEIIGHLKKVDLKPCEDKEKERLREWISKQLEDYGNSI